MNDLFEQLAEAFNPASLAEILRQVEIEAEIKQIENESENE